METYHLRRIDKAMDSRTEMLDVLRTSEIVTIAMCKDNQPYLVTMDYLFDEEQNCLFFHCALAGKKMDYLQINPTVWGQVVEDRGYLAGQCSHAYRSVHFLGSVEFVSDREEKRAILAQMIARFESEPAALRRRLIEQSSLENVAVGKIRIQEMSGKISPPPRPRTADTD